MEAYPPKLMKSLLPIRVFLPAALTALLAFALPASASAQTVVLSDTFGLTGSRVTGGSLAGTMPEFQLGSSAWEASHSNVFGAFSADGKIVTRWRNNDPAQGALPTEMRIALPSYTSGGVISVSASMVTSTSSWVGFGLFSAGFSTNDTQAWFKQENLLSVRLQPNGYWEVASHNGTSLEKLVGGNIASFSATSAYTVGLSYNTDTQMARVYLVNGGIETNLYTANNGWFATGLASETSIGATGFRLHPAGTSGKDSTAGAYSIDNFLVTSTIPELGSFATFLGFGALGGAVVVRRRAELGSR